MLFAVNHYLKRMVKSNMPYKSILIDNVKLIKKINIVIPFIDIGINRKISYSE